MNAPPVMRPAPQAGANSAIAVIESHDNTSQTVVRTTEDRLRLRLIEYCDRLTAHHAWHVPFGLLVTIILVFCSAEFKAAFTLTADTWRAIFTVGGIACTVWLVWSLNRLRKAPSLDDLIAAIKNN